MKRFLVFALVIAGLAAAGLVLFVQLYSPESQRVVLERRLSESFGAPAHIGSLRLSLLGGLGVEARDVRVELDPAFGEGSLLEIDEVHATVSVWHFLTTREIGAREVQVTRPRIRLVKRADGVWNWSTLGAATPSASVRGAHLPALAFAAPLLAAPVRATSSQLERVEIMSANVTLVDATVQPPIITEYLGISANANLDANGDERHVVGQVVGNSEPAGGEPLDVDLPFDLRTRAGETGRWTGTGTISAGRIATRNSQIDDIAATFDLDEAQRLTLPQLRMKLYGGAFDGSAAIDLGTATNRFTLQGRLDELDVARSLNPKPELAGVVSGVATATFQLTGELGAYAETLNSLEGDGTADVRNAKLLNMNLLDEISKKANLTLLDFSESDTLAENLHTSFLFERGSLRLTNATASKISGCVELSVREGRIGLDNQPTVSFDGSVKILPEINQRVRADAPAAQILLAALTRGSGVSVPLRIRGTAASPIVDLDWASVARSLLFGIGQR